MKTKAKFSCINERHWWKSLQWKCSANTIRNDWQDDETPRQSLTLGTDFDRHTSFAFVFYLHLSINLCSMLISNENEKNVRDEIPKEKRFSSYSDRVFKSFSFFFFAEEKFIFALFLFCHRSRWTWISKEEVDRSLGH